MQEPPEDFFPHLLHEVATRLAESEGLSIKAACTDWGVSYGVLMNALSKPGAKKKRASAIALKSVADIAERALKSRAISRELHDRLIYAWIRRDAQSHETARMFIDRTERDYGAPTGRRWFGARGDLVKARLEMLREESG